MGFYYCSCLLVSSWPCSLSSLACCLLSCTVVDDDDDDDYDGDDDKLVEFSVSLCKPQSKGSLIVKETQQY